MKASYSYMQWNSATPAFVIIISLLSTITLTVLTSSLQSASGHGTGTCMQQRWVTIQSQYNGPNTVNVGDTISLAGELENRVNRPVTISLIPVVDDGDLTGDGCSSPAGKYNLEMVQAAGWQIANMSVPKNEFVLEANQTMPFSFELTSTTPGSYHVHAAIEVSIPIAMDQEGQEEGVLEGTYVAYGHTITAYTEEQRQAIAQKCQELGITKNECSEFSIRQNDPNWMLERQWAPFPVPYLIGIGATIAGIIAFLTLRKRR